MKIIDDIKKYNSWQSRYERLKESENNKKARSFFRKNIDDNFSNQTLTEEKEAVLFSQAYQRLLNKNPSKIRFEEIEEYEVKTTEFGYIVKGYCYGTNSYGAEVRAAYELELCKKDNEWTCITDIGMKALKWIILGGIIIFLPSIIAYCSMPKF